MSPAPPYDRRPAASFRAHYGPCAMVAGAAVGLGAAYAREPAARGLDLVLVDRDAAALQATARAVHAQHRVAVESLVLDLGGADAHQAIGAAVADRAIGLV